ncbi:MAG: DNA mismatch repair protein MutS [Bdellovibrionia bacterium]
MTLKSTDELTPLMKQYWDLKATVPDALLLFRMGDFYELFGDDAVTAASILEITLTSRDKTKANPIAMAGVPHHSVQGYIQKLLKAGKKIALGEQVEDPESVKGTGKIVRREIVRVLTPAVQFDVEGSEANYLATLTSHTEGSRTLWILTCLDVSTGEVLISDPLELTSVLQEFRNLPIRHYLHYPHLMELERLGNLEGILSEGLPKNYVSLEKGSEILKKQYQIENLGSFLKTPSALLGLSTLVTYVLRTQLLERIEHLRLPEPLRKPETLVLGPSTAQHLDLADLFRLINHTRSTLGARRLKNWLLAPLLDPQAIELRQSAVRAISEMSSPLRQSLAQNLAPIHDLERILARVNTQLATPKDALALGQSLTHLPHLVPLLAPLQSRCLQQLHQSLLQAASELEPLTQTLVRSLREDAPTHAREGGIFQRGTSPELDRLIDLTENGQRWLSELENREREQTKIPSLKVRYNRVFGYYIEVTQAHLKNVPPHYQRKQTMVGAERFFTDELKRFEEEILTASTRQKQLEQELFESLLGQIQAQSPAIMALAEHLGQLDSLASFASLSLQPGWCMPLIDNSLNLDIRAGRHPMVDQAQKGGFVPNDVCLSPSSRMTLLITGPNMGGKSTIMRQTALIVILGQMGAPVPAQSASWGAFSSVYTRIGAQDAIARGQSTFMVEMSELAEILHHADAKSLIILDEIGRGTSTYDGISVAWATLEWICTKIQARTFFATHYHELIHLSQSLPLLANTHLAVAGTRSPSKKTLRFLYELKEGPTNESFGIHVAQMAGLPPSVIQRAWEVLENLENSTKTEPASPSVLELPLFQSIQRAEVQESEPEVEPPTHPLFLELAEVDPHHLTPMQALETLIRLKTLAAPQDIAESRP